MLRAAVAGVGAITFAVGVISAPAAHAADSSPAQLQAQVDAAQTRADEAAVGLSALQTEMALLEADVAATEARLAPLTAELDAQRAKVEDLLISRYVQGGDRMSRSASLDGAAAAERGEVMLHAVTGESSESIDRFRAAAIDLQAGRAHLDQVRAQQQQRVADLSARQTAAAAEVEELAAAQKRLQASRGAPRAATSPSSFAVSGDWACPVQGALSFTNDWGNPRSGGRSHKGTDMMSPRGTPVVAPVDGVATQKTGGLGGMSVYINGSDGVRYMSMHLSGYAASGQVSKGTVVGYVGNTGNAAGGSPHVHFEIHPSGGAAVNPYPTLSKYC